MQLEKLELLERELSRFAEEFVRLREENKDLRERLLGQSLEIRELKEELELLGAKDLKARQSLARIEVVVARLRELERASAGAED